MKTPPNKLKLAPLPLLGFLLLALPGISAAQSSPRPVVRYAVSLSNPAEHRLRITVSLPPGAAEHELQLPVWNAIYQVRDFSQYLYWIHASNAGTPLPVRQINPSRWVVSGTEHGAEIQYEFIANLPGSFGAELTPQHAFFNLAEILLYADDLRPAPIRIHYSDVPANWHAATALDGSLAEDFSAPNYDRLVDSPIELGSFHEEDFDEGGAHYSVAIDANPADYDVQKLIPALHRIVAAETSWMNDRPFDHYLFIYHFPHSAGGGGMEHAYSTAIELNADYIKDRPGSLFSVTAHEFFHLWNVKRIRPKSLEPTDYTRENYTPSLWFSEGVTSTVGGYALLRADLLDESRYLQHLADTIAEVEARPAHLTQSAEQSSLDAWLEKYPAYWRPERSVSYYSTGELLGVLLDLSLRDATHGTQSLRELFQAMNRDYAQRGIPFPESAGVRQTAEALSHSSFQDFFQKYVSGADEIPWDDFFRSVGLHLAKQSVIAADPSFAVARNYDGPPTVSRISAGGEAERAGLAEGDVIVEMNGKPPSTRLRQELDALRPGDTLRLKVHNGRGDRELQWNVGSRNRTEYRLLDVSDLTAQQKTRRAAWLRGESEPGTSAPEVKP